MTLVAWAGWEPMLSIATVVLAAATVALVVGVLIAWRTLVASRKATQLESYIDVLREYRGADMLAARRRIRDFDYACILEEIPLGDRELVEMVGNYLDQIGVLVKLGLLDVKPAGAFLGGSARNMWEKLAPIIHAERSKGRGASLTKTTSST
jgi:hypothetical protein